jgi:hypothetical protein
MPAHGADQWTETGPAGRFLVFRRRSGDDVGKQLVLNVGDAVFEVQLFFLESRQTQLVGAASLFDDLDGVVQVAMLLLEPREFLPEILFMFAFHLFSDAKADVRRWRAMGAVSRLRPSGARDVSGKTFAASLPLGPLSFTRRPTMAGDCMQASTHDKTAWQKSP